MGSIQSCVGQILGFTGNKWNALRFENAVTLVLSSETQDSLVSYSEAGLQFETQRFKLKVGSGTSNNSLILNFSTPQSGTLYFASANAGTASRVTMWQI